MTILGTGLFFSNTTWTEPAENAAPTIATVTLNFDFTPNAAPVGSNLSFSFEVVPQNDPPQGQNQQFVFDVMAA